MKRYLIAAAVAALAALAVLAGGASGRANFTASSACGDVGYTSTQESVERLPLGRRAKLSWHEVVRDGDVPILDVKVAWMEFKRMEWRAFISIRNLRDKTTWPGKVGLLARRTSDLVGVKNGSESEQDTADTYGGRRSRGGYWQQALKACTGWSGIIRSGYTPGSIGGVNTKYGWYERQLAKKRFYLRFYIGPITGSGFNPRVERPLPWIFGDTSVFQIDSYWDTVVTFHALAVKLP